MACFWTQYANAVESGCESDIPILCALASGITCGSLDAFDEDYYFAAHFFAKLEDGTPVPYVPFSPYYPLTNNTITAYSWSYTGNQLIREGDYFGNTGSITIGDYKSFLTLGADPITWGSGSCIVRVDATAYVGGSFVDLTPFYLNVAFS